MSNEIINPAVEPTQAAAQTITPNQNDTIHNNSASPANEATGNNADASSSADNQLSNNLADNTNMSAAVPPNSVVDNPAVTQTPEQLQAEIDRLNVLMSSQSSETAEKNAFTSGSEQEDIVSSVKLQQESSIPIPSLIPSDTDPQQIVELKAAIVVALVNPEFVKDTKRIERIKEALKMPDEEARVRAQLKSHAEKKLRSDAAIKAEETGVYTAPTLAEINAYIENGVKVWRIKNKK